MAKEIDAKLLEGLTFRGSKPREVKEEETGKKKTVYQAYERPLEPKDVLDWKDNGNSVVIVTSNGKKFTVEKKKAKA